MSALRAPRTSKFTDFLEFDLNIPDRQHSARFRKLQKSAISLHPNAYCTVQCGQ